MLHKADYEQRLEEIFQLPEEEISKAFQKLIKKETKDKNYAIAHDASFQLAAFYYETEHLNKAKQILLPIVTNYMNYPFIPRYTNMLMLLGLIELNEEDFTLANYYFGSGLKLAQKHHLPQVQCLAYSNLAIVDSALHQDELALSRLLEAEKLLPYSSPQQHVLVYLNLAVCYKRLKQYKESQKKLNICIKKYKGLESGRRDLIRCCQMDLYYQLKDTKNYNRLKDEIMAEDAELATPDQIQAYQMICENAFKDEDYPLGSRILERLKQSVVGKDDDATLLFIAKCESSLAKKNHDDKAYIASLEAQLDLTKKISETTSQQLIRSTGVEIELAKLMQKNENTKKQREKERKHNIALAKALSETEKANAAKSEFLSRMSHEIRTPLNAVIGYMQIATEENVQNERVQHCLSNSELAAQHLLSIINDVLDVSAIESGRIKIAHNPYDLQQQISTISTIFYNQARQKDVRFEVHLNNFIESTVVGDSLRVNQIIMNLLSNAVKFTPVDGLVSLYVEQEILDDKTISTTIQVSDSGIGMSKEFLSRMFTPFEQESANTAKNYGGTGLGLAISKNLTTLMNGSIQVDSEQNVGTTFTVILPFERVEQPKIEPTDLPRTRILVVDHQEENQAYYKQCLPFKNIKMDFFTDPIQARKRMERRLSTEYPYTMCILDWSITKNDFLSAVKAIPQKQRPVVVETAYDITEIRHTVYPVDYEIAKPIFQSTLLGLLTHKQTTFQQNTTNYGFENMQILLVEDNEMNLEIATTILTKAGIDIDTAMNGVEAFEAFQQNPKKYDVILMDVQMPKMNGYETTQAIRNCSLPEGKTIPIIAMTANAFSEDVDNALKSGMNDHIAKPIDYQKLYDALKRIQAK